MGASRPPARLCAPPPRNDPARPPMAWLPRRAAASSPLRLLTAYGLGYRLSISVDTNRRATTDRHDLLQGTLDMLILRTLQWGPQHGYAIAQLIRSQSSDVLRVEAGSLYPALQRLAKRRWVTARWGQTTQNQRAKFYRLTAEGKRQLLREQSRWSELVEAIGRILYPTSAPSTGSE
jgi:PadR family transcriptional regulator, regulatory protein PadR